MFMRDNHGSGKYTFKLFNCNFLANSVSTIHIKATKNYLKVIHIK